MKSHRILIIFLIVTILCFFASNSKSVYTIDNSAYVIGIGIDTGSDEKIKLSLQIAVPSSSSGSGSSSDGSEQSSSFIINTVECNTIDSGINLVNSYISKKLNLSYCEVVVFSEEIASKDISNYVATLINDIEVRPYCNIVVSRCDAKYYLQNSKPLLDELSSKYYQVEPSSENNTGYTKEVTFLDFYNDYFDSFCEPFAILGSINSSDAKDYEGNFNTNASNGGTSNDSLIGFNSKDTGASNKVDPDAELPLSSHDNIENLGLAVFHNGTFVGELSASETVYHLIVSNDFKTSTISIPSPFDDSDYIALYITNTKSKNKVKFVNGSPYIICNVSLSARIFSSTTNSNYMIEENLSKIEDYANSYFQARLEDYLYKTSVDLQADIAKFGKYAVKSFLTLDNWNNYNWINNYKNSTFKVSVNTNIKSSYLVVGNKQ